MVEEAPKESENKPDKEEAPKEPESGGAMIRSTTRQIGGEVIECPSTHWEWISISFLKKELEAARKEKFTIIHDKNGNASIFFEFMERITQAGEFQR